MSTYISAATTNDGSKVLLWERDNTGKRVVVEYDAPYYLFIESDDGEYTSFMGDRLTRLDFDNSRDFYVTRKELRTRGVKTYESDFSPELKILSDHYYNKPTTTKLHTTFYDIEVDYDKARGHADGGNPYARISSIALYHEYSGRRVVIALPPKDGPWTGTTIKDIPQDILDRTELYLCESEKELLAMFYGEIENTDIIAGWNSEFFDDPYMYGRTKKILGKDATRLMSFPESDRDVYVKHVRKYGNTEVVVKPDGRVWIDYMAVFKKFDPSERDSYSLEAVAEDELIGLDKLSYEKSLYDLYREDFDEFLRYNIRDTDILSGLEAKFRYVELLIEYSHMTTNMLPAATSTIGIVDTAIRNYCIYETDRLILPDAPLYDELTTEKYDGAYVMEPDPGLYNYIGSVDIKSLYPSAMRSINISPETLIGQFIEKGAAVDEIQNRTDVELTVTYENQMDETLTAKEWYDRLREKTWSVSGHGTVFDQSNDGVIPTILTTWFNERIDTQRKKAEQWNILENKSLDDDTKTKHQKLFDYYDRIQYLKKILLNSVYGVFGNRKFRFFDIRIAESTTNTGKDILMHMARAIADAIDGEYTYPSESPIYGDTDSVYFKTHTNNVEDAIIVADAATELTNASFPPFMRDRFNCSGGRDTYIVAERETIVERGIFIRKKHYMLYAVNIDGHATDTMIVKGLQIKKTSIPRNIRVPLTKMFERFLKGTEWLKISEDIVEFRNELRELDVIDLGIPINVKTLDESSEKYDEDPNSNIPGHTRAAIFYNICLDEYGDKESMKLLNGMKIVRYYFVKGKTFGKFNSIALPIDLDIIPDWFKHFLPYIDKERQIQVLYDSPIRNIITAIGEPLPTEKTLLANEIFTY